MVSRATRENVLNLVLSLWSEDADSPALDFYGCSKAFSDARYFEIRAMLEKQLKVMHLLGNKNQILSQDIFIVWKDVFGYGGLISPVSPPGAVISVKLALKQLGFDNIVTTAAYDADLVVAVKILQSRYGLTPDGLVGPMTKIVFFLELEAMKEMRVKTDAGSSFYGTLSSKTMVLK